MLQSIAVRLAALLCASVLATAPLVAESGSQAAKPAPDTLVLSNGDTLHGKFVRAVDGKIVFHSDVLGDLSLALGQVKELHATGSFVAIDKSTHLNRTTSRALPSGDVAISGDTVRIEVEGAPAPPAPIPAKDARFILDLPTFQRDISRRPGLLSGWSGAATAGATMVTATQRQYTFSGGINLVRTIPTVDWLSPRNRTSIGFTSSFGKISQPAYTDSTGAFVPAVTTKSAIYHAGAERDEYISPRFYALAEATFDHNYSQDLDLQQIYGGGFGWTVLKTPRQEADLKGTVQYDKQTFISSSSADQNLIGSTFAASYVRHIPLLTFTQNLAYLPAWNNTHAYSVTESNTIAFPTYKNLSFTLGTMDSYLNNPPASEPPTRRNSFQFTMGITYAIRPRP
ncbi:MAG: DUF481 domain-containing protein [Terracidiphilus sp.]|nr:DUF481 domain-containing protein [Terracidiphilus sp.]